MLLLDTNVFIYIGNGRLSPSVLDNTIAFASITKIEALGYMYITAAEQHVLQSIFEECQQLDLDEKIIKQAIQLRQLYKLRLGDAIVAATAIVYDLELWTANENDYKNIEGIRIYNPLK